LAAGQAPIIMMSQNRKEEKDRQQAINDYMISPEAGIEGEMTSHLKSIFRPQIAQDKQTDCTAFILKSEKSVK
jgi:uncharacterized membrane protein